MLLQPQQAYAQPQSSTLEVKQIYDAAFHELNAMLSGQSKYRFNRAVFLTENAYFDNVMDTAELQKPLNFLVALCKGFVEVNPLGYYHKDKETVSKWAAIFKVMTDTVSLSIKDDVGYHLPFRYDFDDFLGEKDWSKMFVSKLLTTWTGNCHSLPYLYKMIAEELGVTANLALAPNHIYIKHRSLKDGWYNTELTSAAFPIDAWLMASGYIHLEAIQNSVYMKALDDQESIALCLIDLAEGYKRKTNNADPDFILKCCNTALQYFPNYINALILKAETQKSMYEAFLKANPNPDQVVKATTDKMFLDMQNQYVRIHELGYRQMPKEMYLQWLVELSTEKEKYQNKNIRNFGGK